MDYRHTFDSHLVDIGDAALEVWEAGEGPVTFVSSHPYRANSSPHPAGGLTEALANVGRTFWICGRDVGRSSPESRETKLTLRTFADDTEAVRKALGIDKWIPAGTSAGGCIALTVGLEYPDSVSALVLIGTGPAWDFLEEPYCIYNPRNPVYQYLARLEAEDSRGEAWQRAMIKASIHNQSVVDTLLGGTIHELRYVVNRREFRVGKWDESERLSQINVPTLIVNGRYDWQSGSLRPSLELLEGIKTADYAIMNNSGHMPYTEEPEAFEYAIHEFIERRLLGKRLRTRSASPD